MSFSNRLSRTADARQWEVIATSGPSATYPQLAYRNPVDALVKFLDARHGEDWAIWEFRAEGTGYPDEVMNGRKIHHYPWPDHHPPPFKLVPMIVASMRQWLKDFDAEDSSESGKRVVVVHCKAGKGRSGTACCSYLISEEGWSVDEATERFTKRRMRPGFGAGVSIPSQLRWIKYVDRWTQNKKVYVDQEIEILEIQVKGIREGVRVAIQGYVDEGRHIKNFHVFEKTERILMRDGMSNGGILASVAAGLRSIDKTIRPPKGASTTTPTSKEFEEPLRDPITIDPDGCSHADVVYRPRTPVIVPTCDVNIDFERRNSESYGWGVVTSVAHTWFNAYFEGNGPEHGGTAGGTGTFEIHWDAMDGIKGSSKKGIKAFDAMRVVWKNFMPDGKRAQLIQGPTRVETEIRNSPADQGEQCQDVSPRQGG